MGRVIAGAPSTALMDPPGGVYAGGRYHFRLHLHFPSEELTRAHVPHPTSSSEVHQNYSPQEG